MSIYVIIHKNDIQFFKQQAESWTDLCRQNIVYLGDTILYIKHEHTVRVTRRQVIQAGQQCRKVWHFVVQHHKGRLTSRLRCL